jgi:uncharacterized protein (DUF305 family)
VLEALFLVRLAEARARYTAADVRFMTDMIAHHGQAVLMATMAGGRSAYPPLLTLAARIRTGQADEIAVMQQWLRERGEAVPMLHFTPTSVMTHGGDAHVHGHAGMPGMLSDAQLAELAAATGADFDRLFLSYMIEHHQGAIVMVDTLMAADGAAQDAVVFRLASDVRVEQTAEIARMQRLLMEVLDGRR